MHECKIVCATGDKFPRFLQLIKQRYSATHLEHYRLKLLEDLFLKEFNEKTFF